MYAENSTREGRGHRMVNGTRGFLVQFIVVYAVFGRPISKCIEERGFSAEQSQGLIVSQ